MRRLAPFALFLLIAARATPQPTPSAQITVTLNSSGGAAITIFGFNMELMPDFTQSAAHALGCELESVRRVRHRWQAVCPRMLSRKGLSTRGTVRLGDFYEAVRELGFSQLYLQLRIPKAG